MFGKLFSKGLVAHRVHNASVYVITAPCAPTRIRIVGYKQLPEQVAGACDGRYIDTVARPGHHGSDVPLNSSLVARKNPLIPFVSWATGPLSE